MMHHRRKIPSGSPGKASTPSTLTGGSNNNHNATSSHLAEEGEAAGFSKRRSSSTSISPKATGRKKSLWRSLYYTLWPPTLLGRITSVLLLTTLVVFLTKLLGSIHNITTNNNINDNKVTIDRPSLHNGGSYVHEPPPSRVIERINKKKQKQSQSPSKPKPKTVDIQASVPTPSQTVQEKLKKETPEEPIPPPIKRDYPPRRIYYLMDDPHDTSDHHSNAVSNDFVAHKNYTYKSLKYPMVRPSYMTYLQNSREFRSQADAVYTKECQPQYHWQTYVYPTCNALHEFDLASLNNHGKEVVRLVANGYWRDVWIVTEVATGMKRVVKTLRYEHDLTPRNYDRNRRDAMALERLTSSKHVVDVYGYCSTSGLFEFSDGGDIPAALWKKAKQKTLKRRGEAEALEEVEVESMSWITKLHVATQAAMALADTHNVDKEGKATIAHTDIGPDQFIMIDGRYKLNDFNRARFLLEYRHNHTICPYYVGKNPGKNRSPEEYAYGPQTEMVDMYSYGNIVYTLLMEQYPFEEESRKAVPKLVMEGIRPSMYADLWNSTDPIISTLREAMIMCHEGDPAKRASARKVSNFLKKKLEEVDPGRLTEWGETLAE